MSLGSSSTAIIVGKIGKVIRSSNHTGAPRILRARLVGMHFGPGEPMALLGAVQPRFLGLLEVKNKLLRPKLQRPKQGKHRKKGGSIRQPACCLPRTLFTVPRSPVSTSLSASAIHLLRSL